MTYGLIALNLLAFLVELNQPTPAALQSFITSWDMAHIGGFVAGLLLVKLFAAGRPRPRRRAAFA